MSTGHHHKHDLTSSELDDLLDEVLSNRLVKAELRRPFKVITTEDVPLVGSSGVGWINIYFDRHLPVSALPLPNGKTHNVRGGLIRHERLEPILENLFGWPYAKLAHPVAQHWEERLYIEQGVDPRLVERGFKPFIKADEHEKIKKVATDLDMRPMLDDKKLMEHVKAAQDKEKLPHERVMYIDQSRTSQKCEKCSMFVSEKYGGPSCTLVKSPILPSGWCKRFDRGALDQRKF